MLETPRAYRGMVTAPHHLAAEAGLSVLREGGNAIEAMIAAAATIAVVYPHMNALGGDGFWLIHTPGHDAPVAISAVGRSGAAATPAFYQEQGLEAIPPRGPLAANTVAGTLSGWQAALDLSREWGGRLPLQRLLADAIHYADAGFPLTRSQAAMTAAKAPELMDVPGWSDSFLDDGEVPAVGSRFTQPALAATLKQLADKGMMDLYTGGLARRVAADLARVGSPVTEADLREQRAVVGSPLSLKISGARLFNVPPPSQGLASLIILGIFDRLACAEAESFDHLHGLVEACKRAIRIRNQHVGDPTFMTTSPEHFLEAQTLESLATHIDRAQALPWRPEGHPGDTVWLGSVDGAGRSVSFIHSIYWEFGSGVVLRDSGITWQNRGSSFALAGEGPNVLTPRRLPFHTNNPAMACFDDGRVLAYGAMGGEGQPQTQAQVFTRYARFGQTLQEAVTAPRWVLSRTWGAPRSDLRLESRFDPCLCRALQVAGHEVTQVAPFDDVMGHAGALVYHADGLIEGASDPRCDGQAVGF